MTARRYLGGLLALSALALRAPELSGQVQIISLAAAAASTLTVTVQSGAVQTIASVVDNAVNDFPAPVTLQTAWNVNPGQTNTVRLVAYFSVPGAGNGGGATQIPSSRILGRMSTGIPVAYTAMTQNAIGGVAAGGSLQLFTVNISGGNKNAARTDNLDLRLDLTGFPTLPAGSFAGVLNIQAVTQ